MNKMLSEPFMFATGIENSYPTILLPDGTVERVDELAKTDHYKQWETDFSLPGRYWDFSFDDTGRRITARISHLANTIGRLLTPRFKG